MLHIVRQDDSLEEVTAHAVDHIGSPFAALTAEPSEIERNFPLSVTDREPDILLGIRDFWRFFSGRTEVGPDRVIVHTTIGDIICGRWQLEEWDGGTARVSAFCLSASNREALLDSNQVSDFWALETIGIRDDPQENEDAAAMDMFRRAIGEMTVDAT